MRRYAFYVQYCTLRYGEMYPFAYRYDYYIISTNSWGHFIYSTCPIDQYLFHIKFRQIIQSDAAEHSAESRTAVDGNMPHRPVYSAVMPSLDE